MNRVQEKGILFEIFWNILLQCDHAIVFHKLLNNIFSLISVTNY